MSSENLSGNLPNKVNGNHQRPLPRDFEDANFGDLTWKSEKGVYNWDKQYLMPSCLNIVDFAVAPPTLVAGDIYVGNGDTTTVDAGWDGVGQYDWARYDGTSWFGISPDKGSKVYNKDSSSGWIYDAKWREREDVTTVFYRAVLTQDGTSDPVPTVKKISLGVLAWSRVSQGRYEGALTGAFPENATYILAGSARDVFQLINMYRENESTVKVETFDKNGNLVDDVLQETAIYIEV